MEDETALEIYSIPVQSGDVLTGTGADNIVVKLLAEVTKNPLSVVTGAVVATGADADGILFTAKEAGNDFAVMLMAGLLQDADIFEFHIKNGALDGTAETPLVQYVKGEGTPDQIRECELNASLRDGNTNTQLLTKHMWSVPSAVQDGIEYDQQVLGHVSNMSDAIMRENNPQQTLTVAGQTADIATVTTLLIWMTYGSYSIP